MSTIKVNTLDTTSGTEITVASGKTLSVGGKSITAGSSNIQRATGDVTVATTTNYGVAGKSELVIAANASAATRTITLCPVTETGVDTCIITVVADADATSTYKLTVLESDGSTEVWTGYQTGDFVRLIVSNSAWLVVDHKETYFSSRYLTANTAIATSATTKLTGWTNISEIGNTWDDANDKHITPTGMNGYWTLYFVNTTNANYASLIPTIYINGSAVDKYNQVGATAQGYLMGTNTTSGKYYTTSTQVIEWYSSNIMSGSGYDAQSVGGGSAVGTHFIAQFERVY